MAGLGLWGCGYEVASVDVTTQPTSRGSAVTSTMRTSGVATTVTISETATTTDGFGPMTTSEAFAAGSKKGMEAALQLGVATISYLSEKGDLATVQGLVAASAQEGLARDEFPLDASLGDTFFVALVKTAYYGTRALKQNECWVQANWAVFAVDDNGRCTRVMGADVDPENRSEYTLSDERGRTKARRSAFPQIVPTTTPGSSLCLLRHHEVLRGAVDQLLDLDSDQTSGAQRLLQLSDRAAPHVGD
jgi:hypothetical protein